MRRRIGALAIGLALVAAACTSGGGTGSAAHGTTTTTTKFSGTIDLDLSKSPAGCDPLDTRSCLLPFPDDFFTVADKTTDTGRRVDFPADSFPANTAGKHVDPTPWNGNDGFSPGSEITLYVPGIDLAKSGIAPITDIGKSLDPDAPVVLVDASTGERRPYWAELDAHATSDANRLMFVHPAVNFEEGHRYIVAVRDLKTATGADIPPADAFRAYRDRLKSTVPAVEARRPHMEDIFKTLASDGIARDDLYLTWDFTVASERNLSERLLHIRDDAYSKLGDGVPAFTVESVTDNVSADVGRRVTGSFDVPLYLTGKGEAGSAFNYGADGLPAANGTYKANFICVLPTSALSGSPGRAIVYGHGLLGSADEVNSFGGLANKSDLVMCATDWIGMSQGDLGNVASVLAGTTSFATLADRLQQGILNFQFLARLLKDPRGFATNAAFQSASGQSVLRPNEVYFNGNSQGGIIGGAATAISKEWTRAVLGVPAMNYSTLLPRSVDYDPFDALAKGAFPDEVDRPILVALDQMLWDRGENDGYAWHMTDHPYPNTPAHKVMLIEAFGDHQVANIATEVMARTIGAKIREPALAAGRSTAVEPFWHIAGIPTTPYDGSVLVMWDYGTPAPPTDNVPPRPPQYGSDPHGAGAKEPRVGQMAAAFLDTDGTYIDVCNGSPCHTP